MILGLHTKKEQKEAMDMAYDAYNRGVDASMMAKPMGLSSEIGYLVAIAELARLEGAEDLAQICNRMVDDLTDRFERNFPEIIEE